MDNLVIGYYLKPHVWIGSKEQGVEPKELAFYEENFSKGIDLGVQRQGLVIAKFSIIDIPGYRNRNVSNTIGSETASFVLNFFNALSFAHYEANLKKYSGGFQSIPQQVEVNDLFLWNWENNESLKFINNSQPVPVCTGEADTFTEMVNKGLKTVGSLDERDLQFRPEVDPETFGKFLEKAFVSKDLRKLFALLNRGTISIRQASFDVALVSFWTAIESILKDLWAELLGNKNIAKKRREYLCGRDFTTAIISENLNLLGIIDDDLYEEIGEVRKTRNKLLHELRGIEPKVCYQAFDACKKLISIKFNIEIHHRGGWYFGDITFEPNK